MNVEPRVPKGWSFDDLKNPTESKFVMDPITVLVHAALLPCYGDKIKFSATTGTLQPQEQSKYTYSSFGYELHLRPWVRWWNGDDNNNLQVFEVNAINAAEYFDPTTDANIKKLFELAISGLPAAGKTYEPKPEENKKGKSSPVAAVSTYTGTLTQALNGRIQFPHQLSQAEIAVKGLWEAEEISMTIANIESIRKLKDKNKDVSTFVQTIHNLLNKKEEAFKEICRQVNANTLSTVKHPKPQQEALAAEPPQQAAKPLPKAKKGGKGPDAL